MNSINKNDNKSFEHAETVAWNHKEIGQNPERIRKIKPFINKYNWKGIKFPSEKMVGTNLRKIM